LFELELEGLSNEDREFEVAKRFVRFATDATRRASSAAALGAPARTVVTAALKQAAYNHAPGLLRKRNRGGMSSSSGTGSSGTWRREGSSIVLYGA
jgi:hypothetical protein